MRILKIDSRSLSWFAVFAVFMTACGMNAATTLTFDDLTANADNTVVPNGYGGFEWNNFTVINGLNFSTNYGYHNGVVSSPNVVYNPYGDPASISSQTLFNFDSAFLTAAQSDGLRLEIKGLVGSRVAYDNTYTLSVAAPTLIQFNYLRVNEIDFIRVSSPAQNFVMDDLTVAVPEPSILQIGTLGAVALIVASRKIFRKKDPSVAQG